jgi:hypothetical protein
MTRTRPDRTVVKSAIASMTARRSRTTPPTSFAVSAVTLATWPVIVQTGRGAPVGAMMALRELVLLLVALVVVTLSTASTRYVPTPPFSVYHDADSSSSNSCKNSKAMVPPLPVSKQVRELTTTATALVALVAEEPMLDPGSVVQPAALPPGAVGTRTGTTKVEPRPLVRPAARHLGLVTAAIVIVEVAAVTTGSQLLTLTMVVEMLMVEALLRLAPPLGTRLLQLLQLIQALTRAMVPMALPRA